MSEKASGDGPVAVGGRLHNRIVDSMRDYERRRLGGAILSLPSAELPNTLRIRNSTGGALARGSVVDIDDYLLSESDPLDDEHPFFDGITQAGGCWAVLRDATPSLEFGDGQIAGRAIARVNIVSLDHARAFPKAGQTYFESSHMGPVRILRLSDTDATGVQECMVLLNVPLFMLLGITVDPLERNTAGTVNLVKKISTGSGYAYKRNGGGSILNLESYAYPLNSGVQVAANTLVFIEQFEDGVFQAVSGNCAATDLSLS